MFVLCPEQNAPLKLGVLVGVPRPLCLGRGGSPSLLTAQLCIYSLFARKNLFIFRVATCQRLPAQDNPITPLMVSPERANNRWDCRGGGLGGWAGGQGKRLPQAPGSCLGVYLFFFRGTRSSSIKSCKINSGFVRGFFGSQSDGSRKEGVPRFLGWSTGMRMCSAPGTARTRVLCLVGYSCPSGLREEQDLLQNLPSTPAHPHICRRDLEGSSGHLPIEEQHLEEWQRGFL